MRKNERDIFKEAVAEKNWDAEKQVLILLKFIKEERRHSKPGRLLERFQDFIYYELDDEYQALLNNSHN